ncbi:Por secretion system C-terminal sorting domain-containing protein [Chryseobacterium carnipullorum]|uniref:T9SS type A sorting domain-containing protein n=1 Tax=Chryseobacterium carnipullorum TaxID=1124835 RepID=UPI00091C23E9|nr:T9SS type A sorting domain-containing protein [Chryseobacterium carnipullorum]SHL97061.1 Por secretion system C-terminal sorting domain-containing protein [Chryseobacterium carnipullorum]
MTKHLLSAILLCYSAFAFSQNSITSTSTAAGATTTYTFNLVAGSGGQTWNAISAVVVPGSTLPAFAGNASPSSVSNIDVFLNGSTTEANGYLRNFGNGELKIDINQAIPQGTTIKVVIKNVTNPSAPATNLTSKIAFQNSSYANLNSYSAPFNITSGTLSTVEHTSSDHKIVLYPNPTTDYIKITSVNSKEKYAIYSFSGQLVLSGEYTADKNIDVRSLPKGSYILTIRNQSIQLMKD